MRKDFDRVRHALDLAGFREPYESSPRKEPATRTDILVASIALVVMIVALFLSVASCATSTSDVVTVPYAAPCPAGYHFLFTDHGRRVGLCSRDSTESR